jgi:hypothetical protein
MPRIYSRASDPLDFCKPCFPDPDSALALYGVGPDGADGRGDCYGYDEEHPPYSDTDYTCEVCGDALTDKDD